MSKVKSISEAIDVIKPGMTVATGGWMPLSAAAH